MTDEEFRQRMELRKALNDLFISRMLVFVTVAACIFMALKAQEKQWISGLDLFFISVNAAFILFFIGTWISEKNKIKKIRETIECLKNRAGK